MLWAFGHGLSYTTFTYSDAVVPKSVSKTGTIPTQVPAAHQRMCLSGLFYNSMQQLFNAFRRLDCSAIYLWSLSTRLILLFVGAAGTLEVSVKVSNTGSSDGEEVAQLYLRDVISSVTQPVLRSEKQFLSAFEYKNDRFTKTGTNIGKTRNKTCPLLAA